MFRVDPDLGTEEIHPCDGDSVEYFFASDASAIIEHTNRYSSSGVHMVVGYAVHFNGIVDTTGTVQIDVQFTEETIYCTVYTLECLSGQVHQPYMYSVLVFNISAKY